MTKEKENFYDNLTNQELIEITMCCMQTIQIRSELQQYLTEMTYNVETDQYEYEYNIESFKNIILDFNKYLHSKMYKIDKNRRKRQ